jgi:hypothetical protein
VIRDAGRQEAFMNWMVLALALCGAAIRAEGAPDTTSQEVTVWVDDHAPVPWWVMERAKSAASEAFAAIGVHIRWRAGKPRPESKAAATGCAGQNDRPIAITTLLNTAESLEPGARALADLRTDSITVFYDRIRLSVRMWQRLEPVLLANVLVHEISHVLQQVGIHSETGIMKAHWTMADFHEMDEKKTLPFTLFDIGMIRHGVASRVSASCPDSAGPRNP